MLKFLFLFLFSFNLFAQSTQSVDYGFYWFKSGNSSVKASMTGDTISGFYDPKKPTVIYFSILILIMLEFLYRFLLYILVWP